MSTDPSDVGTAPDDKRAERNLFENVIIRDGGDVTIRFSQLSQDLDHTVDVAGVLTERAVGTISAKASAFLSQLGAAFKDAHEEVKARRTAAGSSSPPSDPPPPPA